MSGPRAGTYHFIHAGFSRQHVPQLTLHQPKAAEFESLQPCGHSLTLRFNTSERRCTGWHNLATAKSYACPDQATLPAQYTTCRRCQHKTGFNPAFYHANSVSPQQQARNAEPHNLYLAHFAPGVIKVGITWAQRGLNRLLDQGARSAIVLATYPTADAARQQEATIASLPGIAETLQSKLKHNWLLKPYNAEAAAAELQQAALRISTETTTAPQNNNVIHLDNHFLGEHKLRPQSLVLLDGPAISGRCLGAIGSLLVMEQDGLQFGLNLNKYVGYLVELSLDETANQHAPQQVSLF